MRLWRLILLALFLGVAGLLVGSPTTTAASGTTFTYDASAHARLDADASAFSGVGQSRLSDLPQGSAAPSVEAWGTSTTPVGVDIATNTANDVLRFGTKDSWGNLNTLDDHFARHGADFGATSADDYARQAFEFFQQPGTLTKIDPKTGVIRVYDPATEAFGAYNPTGTTRTFYIPDPAKHGYPTNLDYWNAQPG